MAKQILYKFDSFLKKVHEQSYNSFKSGKECRQKFIDKCKLITHPTLLGHKK